MAATSNVEYSAYDQQFIESNAVVLADTIILHKGPGKILSHINAAGVCNIDYTRTISLIVQQIIQILHCKDTGLYLLVKDEVVNRAASTYMNYWKEVLCGTPHWGVAVDDYPYPSLALDTVDPLAVSAYIGDLHALGYLSRSLLTTCMTYMVNHFTKPFHLRYIQVILERANSYPVPRLAPFYILECISTIRNRAYQLFGKEISAEEDCLTHLLYCLLFKTHTTQVYCEHEDSRLPQHSEITNSCAVSNNDNGNKSDDHLLSARSSALNLASSPARSPARSTRKFFYKPRTFEELDVIWEYCDAVYASPDPEDLPPIDF